MPFFCCPNCPNCPKALKSLFFNGTFAGHFGTFGIFATVPTVPKKQSSNTPTAFPHLPRNWKAAENPQKTRRKPAEKPQKSRRFYASAMQMSRGCPASVPWDIRILSQGCHYDRSVTADKIARKRKVKRSPI